MKQGVLVAIIVGVVVVALGLGFLLSQNIGGGNIGSASTGDLERQIADLTARLNRIEAGGPIAPGGYKIAFVDMFKVLESLYSLDNEVVKAALQEYQAAEEQSVAEINEANQQFQNGEITLKQKDDKIALIQQQLLSRNLELSAPIQAEILKTVRGLGQSSGYALILDNPASKLNPIVMYSAVGLADDITQLVTDSVKESLKTLQPQEE